MTQTPPAGPKFLSSAWIKTHKTQTYAGAAAVGVGGYALYRRRQSAAASAANTATASTNPTSTVPTQYTDPSAGYGTDSGYYPGTGIGNGYVPITVASPTNTIGTVAPATGATAANGPNGSPTSFSYDGTSYNEITNPAAGSAYAAAGDSIYAYPKGQYTGAPILAVQNGQWTPGGKALPAGSTLYVQG